jgi:microcystin-dependent protein
MESEAGAKKARGTYFELNGHYILMEAPEDLDSNFEMILPTSSGNAGDLLTSQGDGSPMAWAAPGSVGFVPPGAILPFAGSSVPSGFLLCDGSAYDTATHLALSAALGSTWDTAYDPTTGSNHSSPGAGNFRVPDLRGVFTRGVGTPSGLSAVSLAGYGADQIKSHSIALSGSGFTTVNTAPSTNPYRFVVTSAMGGGVSPSQPISEAGLTGTYAGGSETAPRYIGVNYIIKE